MLSRLKALALVGLSGAFLYQLACIGQQMDLLPNLCDLYGNTILGTLLRCG